MKKKNSYYVDLIRVKHVVSNGALANVSCRAITARNREFLDKTTKTTNPLIMHMSLFNTHGRSSDRGK